VRRLIPGSGGEIGPAVAPHSMLHQGLLACGFLSSLWSKLGRQGLRDKVKVLIGGGPVSKKYAEDIGADGYGNDAAQAVHLVQGLLQQNP